MELVKLSNESSAALRKCDWATLKTLSFRILLLIKKSKSYSETDIRKVARNYLCSIVGDGEFLLRTDDPGVIHFQSGANKFHQFLQTDAREFRPLLSQEIRDLQQIQLYLTQDRSDARNKAASSLRRIGRPQLAIDLASVEISKSRLNYYARVIRGSAEVDLGLYDEAIEDAEIALKHSLPERKYYPLIVLARAKTGNCKKYGLLSDGEEAIQLALQALSLDESIYTVKVFISAVRTTGSGDYEELISKLESKNHQLKISPDSVALEVAETIVAQTGSFDDSEEGLEWLNDPDALDDSEVDIFFDEEEKVSDYFEDYFEEYSDSLNDPQKPHLEP